jgi:hypothetical protein
MAAQRDNTNYIYRMGTAPNTRVAVSQKTKVYGYMANSGRGFQQIGVVSEFGFDESRTIDPVRGVGFGDQVAELVPGVTEPMTLTLNRTLLYTVNIMQVLGYRGGVEGLVRSLKHHRWPFDLKQELVFSEISSDVQKEIGEATGFKKATAQPVAIDKLVTNEIKALFTFYEGCWLNSYSASFTSDAAMVAENSSVTVTDIIDGFSNYGEWIDSGLAPIGANGTAGAGYSLRFAGGAGTNQTAGAV